MWEKIPYITDHNEEVEASAPVIISASRATDIPAVYMNWFLHRLKRGYSEWENPFNKKRDFVAFDHLRLIVFWSKNPFPLISALDYLKERNINHYLHFTLNDYEKEKFESGLPTLSNRVDTFRQLVDKAGFGKVIWRFDPLILTDKLSTEDLLRKIESIGDQLYGYTEKLVFSFLKVEAYPRAKQNMQKLGINCRDFTDEDIHFLMKELGKLNEKWKYQLATCAEEMDLSQYNVQHNKCVDDDLIIKHFSDDEPLMHYLGIKFVDDDLFHTGQRIVKTRNIKDAGQRKACGCVMSKDIGQYNTCPHGCVYCYANISESSARCNYYQYRKRTDSDNEPPIIL